jgi:hypothetical protein
MIVQKSLISLGFLHILKKVPEKAPETAKIGPSKTLTQ